MGSGEIVRTNGMHLGGNMLPVAAEEEEVGASLDLTPLRTL
jgi:hypothetical protein